MYISGIVLWVEVEDNLGHLVKSHLNVSRFDDVVMLAVFKSAETRLRVAVSSYRIMGSPLNP